VNEPVYINDEPFIIDPFAILALMEAENDDAYESWDSVVYQRLTAMDNDPVTS
jgi:hypothetical protein